MQNSITVWVIDREPRGFVMRWDDPQTGKRRERKCLSKKRRDAEREASDLEAELNDPARQTESPTGHLTFDEMLTRYEGSQMRGKSSDYAYQLKAAVKRINSVAEDRGIGILLCKDITTEFMASVVDLLIDEVSIATAKSYRGCLRAVSGLGSMPFAVPASRLEGL